MHDTSRPATSETTDIQTVLLQRTDQDKCSRKGELLRTRQVVIPMKRGQWDVGSFRNHKGILRNTL